MTFRMLHEMLAQFVRDHPGHESLDEHVVVRLNNGDDLHVGGLRSLAVDAGCTETFVLVLDVDQEADETAQEALELDTDQEADVTGQDLVRKKS